MWCNACGVYRSPGCLQTRVLPSWWSTLYLDSSLIITIRHSARVQRRWTIAHCCWVILCCLVRGRRTTGRHALKFLACNRLRIVWSDTLMLVPALNCSRKRLEFSVRWRSAHWVTMYLGSLADVTRCLPERSLFVVVPVWIYRSQRRSMVLV